METSTEFSALNHGSVPTAKCRLCEEACEGNNRLFSDRDFRERLVNIIGKWIDVGHQMNNHICEACVQTIEQISNYRETLRENINKKRDGDETNLEGIATESNNPPKRKRGPKRKTITSEEMTRRKCMKRYKADQGKVLCTICGASVTPRYMEGHMNRHSGLEPHVCDCGKSFHCKTNLINHKLRMHVNDGLYPCELCDKVLQNRKQYTSHKYTHLEKKFECQICSLKIPSRADLKRHMDMHTQTRDFKCDQCGKGFYARAVLKLHLRTHSGEAAYTCPCPKGFVHRVSYVKHMRASHPDKPIARIDTGKVLKEAFRERMLESAVNSTNS